MVRVLVGVEVIVGVIVGVLVEVFMGTGVLLKLGVGLGVLVGLEEGGTAAGPLAIKLWVQAIVRILNPKNRNRHFFIFIRFDAFLLPSIV